MKKILFLFAVLIVCTTAAKSQQFYINAGKTISTFDYKNSLGEELPNMQHAIYNSMGVGFRTEFFTPSLFMKFGASYNTYGAISSDDEVFNYFEWDLTYLGAVLGFDLNVVKFNAFTILLKASAAAEFMVQGTRTKNEEVINLVGVEDFDAPVFFYRGGIGAQYDFSERVAVFADYMYGKSTSFKKNPEIQKISSHNINLGILINLFKKPASYGGGTVVGNADVTHLEKQLKKTSKRIDELEKNAKDVEDLEKDLAKKDEEMQKLKEDITKALFDFDGNGYTVEERDGKLHLIMDTELLFETGSWKITYEGREAIWLVGEVLAKNTDLKVLIEGHTDNTPYNGGELIKDNWDLSTKRATAVVEILKTNDGVNLHNLTAAGRGEHDPIASNDTEEGKAKNRRIEFILTPNLKKVSKILK